jgi:hypothetical protein
MRNARKLICAPSFFRVTHETMSWEFAATP